MEQIVYARTTAEFLNETFGTDYKAWKRSRWEYDEDKSTIGCHVLIKEK